MTLAIVESPYGSCKTSILKRNIAYARYCVRWAILRGYTPFASHLLYTQPCILDDRKPQERELGIELGLITGDLCPVTLVFVDLGISRGMRYGIQRAKDKGKSIHYTSIFSRTPRKIPAKARHLIPCLGDDLLQGSAKSPGWH